MIGSTRAADILAALRPRDEFVRFANALVGESDDPSILGALINTPEQFGHEYAAWLAHGRPESGFLFERDPLERELECDMRAAADAFLAETVGIGESRRVIAGSADRAMRERNDAVAQRRWDS